MDALDRFHDYYAVITSPVLLVDPSGRLLAFNPAASREFSLGKIGGAESFYLQDLFSDSEDRIIDYLKHCARTKSALPAGFTGNTAHSIRYSARGRLLSTPKPGQLPEIIIAFQAKEKVVEEFLVLNEKILELGREIKRRQDLEDEKRILLESERVAKEEAVEASKAKSLFLAQMSHEIRTPLNAILGFTELIKEGQSLGDDSRRFLDRITTNGRQLLRIIDDILDLSKFEAGKVQIEKIKFSVVEHINEIVNSIRPLAASKNLELEMSFATPIPQVIQSDPVRLRQILINLIGNAIKFTEVGKIELGLTFSPARPGEEAQIEIEIADTGIGISETQQGRLFQAFEQGDASTNRRFGGTGLGLAISKKFARALGGNLSLKSSGRGRGSCFKLSLPTGDVENTLFVSRTQDVFQYEERKLRSAKRKLPKLSGVRILLAEDSLDGAQLATLYLETEGASVFHVLDGFGALKAVESESFDVILMDVQMPGLDGLETTRRLRSRGYVKPIFALTAHALRGDVERSIEAGCNSHLTKPINRTELVEEILHAQRKTSANRKSDRH